MPADHTQCRVRKQSDECESEKRLVKSQRSGDALTEYGARGALAGHALPPSTACGRTTALPSRENALIIFFGPELGLYRIRSPSSFARLHNSFAFTETRIDYFFRPGARTEPHMGDIFRIFLSTAERRLTADRSNQISVRVIATVGITRGRKTVLPSRNPCDSDPFSVARSQSSTSVAKLFAFREPIRSRFVFVTRSPSSNSVAKLFAFRKPIRSRFSVRVFVSEHQFVRLQGTISTHLFLWPGESLDGVVTIFGSGPGWN